MFVAIEYPIIAIDPDISCFDQQRRIQAEKVMMKSDIHATFVTADASLSDTLIDYFQAASNSDLDILKKEAVDIAFSVSSLLDGFGAEFWRFVANVEDIEQYKGDDDKTECVLHFRDIDYPYAYKFKDQFETWLSAIGCEEVYADVEKKFSEFTVRYISDARKDYSEGKLSIFLGAGVSVELGLPLWGELLERMAVDYYKDGVPDKLTSKSLEEQARWHKKQLDNRYYECVKNSLYRNIYKSGASTSRLFDQISRMDRVRAICTYNYDDLLERNGNGKYKSVASACDGYRSNEIPVYHVHGLLPYIGHPKGQLVFSEDEYHSLYNDHQNWANVIQINLLRECTCILIGISLSDPNLRRILDLIGKEKAGDTFLILKMNDVKNAEEAHLKEWVSSKDLDRETFSNLNVLTIWVHSYDQIPLVLEECIKNA